MGGTLSPARAPNQTQSHCDIQSSPSGSITSDTGCHSLLSPRSQKLASPPALGCGSPGWCPCLLLHIGTVHASPQCLSCFSRLPAAGFFLTLPWEFSSSSVIFPWSKSSYGFHMQPSWNPQGQVFNWQ